MNSDRSANGSEELSASWTTWQTPAEAMQGVPPSETFSADQPLNPVPTPATVNLEDLGPELLWTFLQQTNVPPDLHAVAMQLSQATLGLAILKQRIEQLEAINEARAFAGCGLARDAGPAD